MTLSTMTLRPSSFTGICRVWKPRCGEEATPGPSWDTRQPGWARLGFKPGLLGGGCHFPLVRPSTSPSSEPLLERVFRQREPKSQAGYLLFALQVALSPRWLQKGLWQHCFLPTHRPGWRWLRSSLLLTDSPGPLFSRKALLSLCGPSRGICCPLGCT